MDQEKIPSLSSTFLSLSHIVKAITMIIKNTFYQYKHLYLLLEYLIKIFCKTFGTITVMTYFLFLDHK